MIGHVDSICDLHYFDDFVDPGPTFPYSPWLRASIRGCSFTPNVGQLGFGHSCSTLRGSHIFEGFRPPESSTSQPERIPVAPGYSNFNNPRVRGPSSENSPPIPEIMQPHTRENNSRCSPDSLISHWSFMLNPLRSHLLFPLDYTIEVVSVVDPLCLFMVVGGII
ncbi:hypothetical protein Salat_2380200 [Sesamum alatum]|uniref:Uncharacterized protein n=1 Tax=Sesamum alatum TaxID=300844 RepID=A0AAE2CEZ3_9LAMI|nr:hypothetical protein Salat_2380200 [Sesamum alatum]